MRGRTRGGMSIGTSQLTMATASWLADSSSTSTASADHQAPRGSAVNGVLKPFDAITSGTSVEHQHGADDRAGEPGERATRDGAAQPLRQRRAHRDRALQILPPRIGEVVADVRAVELALRPRGRLVRHLERGAGDCGLVRVAVAGDAFHRVAIAVAGREVHA